MFCWGMTVGQKKYSCKYPGCNNGYYWNVLDGYVNKHLFRFPRDPKNVELWKDACNITVNHVKNHYICQDHFRDTDFFNERKERLIKNAVPLPVNSAQLSLNNPPSLLDNEITLYKCLSGQSNFPLQCSHVSNSTSSHSQNKKVTSHLQDHNYCL